MKKLSYLIVLALILGLVLTGCLLSNVGQVPTSEQSGITYLTKNGIPSFNLNIEPERDFNPVGTDHTVTATVTIDKVGGDTEPAPGVLVDFAVYDGTHIAIYSDYTDKDGVATIDYTRNDAGMDTITAEINYAPYVSVVSEEVTKYWLENFVTGGGKINMSTLEPNGNGGKEVALTFGGTVGVLEGLGIVGQFQIVVHTELEGGIGGKGAVSLHCSDFTYLEFSGGPAESPAATHNIATFEGNFTIKGWDIETVLVKLQIIDNGEPGAGVDTFCFCDPYCNELTIDGGNFQVHNLDG